MVKDVFNRIIGISCCRYNIALKRLFRKWEVWWFKKTVKTCIVTLARGGGGGTQIQWGPHQRNRDVFRGRRGLFKTSACPRFCKRRVLICIQVQSMSEGGGGGGVKIPLQSTKYTRLWRRVTPEMTGLPSLLPPLAAAKQAEDYKI